MYACHCLHLTCIKNGFTLHDYLLVQISRKIDIYSRISSSFFNIPYYSPHPEQEDNKEYIKIYFIQFSFHRNYSFFSQV